MACAPGGHFMLTKLGGGGGGEEQNRISEKEKVMENAF